MLSWIKNQMITYTQTMKAVEAVMRSIPPNDAHVEMKVMARVAIQPAPRRVIAGLRVKNQPRVRAAKTVMKSERQRLRNMNDCTLP
mmetsp:Transcript_37149/g.72033  ORF Transcript_37149/g.72033 Transcript_37149/m.72033 type:complete len:86 (+) Transcript_37149:175-432(+)